MSGDRARPLVRGRCPGAHRPMASLDGLVVRVRPRMGRLSAAQGRGLCALAIRHGTGILELTSRANLQIRGVAEAGHPALLDGLGALGLIDAEPEVEARRNVLVAPFWEEGDPTHRLALALEAALPRLPELPSKVGFAVDAGPAPMLTLAPADFRLERGAKGLVLRADGQRLGRPVEEAGAVPALLEMARWFAGHRAAARRMRDVVPPAEWTTDPPRDPAPAPEPGPRGAGHGDALVALPFGEVDAAALAVALCGARSLRALTGRLMLIEGGPAPKGTITDPDDPLRRVDACPGAPFCPQATVETRALARALAGGAGTLHVSGCAKGCARQAPADAVLTGRGGRFDLALRARAGDPPRRMALDPGEVATALEAIR